MAKGLALVVDDDTDLGGLVATMLRQADVDSIVVDGAEPALAALEVQPVDVVLTDLRMPGTDGLALLETLQRRYPELPVIMMTADASVEAAVGALRAGASDFVTKPLDPDEILFAISKQIASSRHAEAASSVPLPTGLLGESSVMKDCLELMRKAARTQATVLLQGESGTGKELAARAIHELSPRAGGPFSKIHCAALPDSLLESELFGYEKGAFTGAVTRKPGRVDLAAGGTLLLDEIGDITPAFQVKILRLLQERNYERLGGTETLTADLRFVLATHRDLHAMVREGTFREDLYYRLNVVPITLPPLRERDGDVALLAQHFFAAMATTHGFPSLQVEEGALELLDRYHWPGNVRELLNIVERLVVLSDGQLVRRDELVEALDRARASMGDANGPPPREQGPEETERETIVNALTKAKYNRTVAARILGITRRTLYNRMKAMGLQ